MSDIPTKILRKIRKYEPVETEGLTLYPILTEEYEEFTTARSAIEFMQQALPLPLINVPLLQAYYTLDGSGNGTGNGEAATGLLIRAVLFLALALRIGQGLPAEKRVALFRFRADRKAGKLKSIVFTPDGEEICEITPAAFQRIRPILAAQNGLTIPEADENPELVQAEAELNRQRAPELEFRLESLVSSVAALTGTDEKDIYGWPIAKLQERQRALHRAMDYLICGIGEAQGTKWKKGNPVPNPFYERKKTESAAKVGLDSFAGGAAVDAIRQGSEAAPP